MTRGAWIAVGVLAVVAVLYFSSKASAASRVPLTRGDVGGGGGLLDGINNTVVKLGSLFRNIGGSSSGGGIVGATVHENPTYGDDEGGYL